MKVSNESQATTENVLTQNLLVQAYLVLLRFAFVAVFYKLKVCRNSASSKSVGAIFPTACAHFVSLCHILVTVAKFQTFSLLL
jgi:hypothetical protein